MINPEPNTSTAVDRFSRRAILSLVGLGAIGIIPPVTESNKANTRSSPEEVETGNTDQISGKLTRRPYPLSAQKLGYRQYVPSNERIHHTVSWTTVGDEKRTVLEEFNTVTEHTFFIDGEQIAASDGTWYWERHSPATTAAIDQQQWELKWVYSTPAKPPGSYEFEAVVKLTQPFTSKISSGETKTQTGIQRHSGKYIVPSPEIVNCFNSSNSMPSSLISFSSRS